MGRARYGARKSDDSVFMFIAPIVGFDQQYSNSEFSQAVGSPLWIFRQVFNFLGSAKGIDCPTCHGLCRKFQTDPAMVVGIVRPHQRRIRDGGEAVYPPSIWNEVPEILREPIQYAA